MKRAFCCNSTLGGGPILEKYTDGYLPPRLPPPLLSIGFHWMAEAILAEVGDKTNIVCMPNPHSASDSPINQIAFLTHTLQFRRLVQWRWLK